MSSNNSRNLTPSGVCSPTQPNRYAAHMPPSQREFDCVEEQRPRELDKNQHIGLIFEWDNGERLDPNISCYLTIGGKTTVHRLADGKNLFCPAPAGEYVAQLLKDVDTNKNLDEAREQLAKALAEIIVYEKKEAAALKKIQDERNFVSNYAHLYYKQARGFALTGWRFSKNLKEWNDLINPFNQLSNALIAAWNAESTDGASWTKSLIQNYSKRQKDELIEALGFDPNQIDIEQLAEAYEYACFIYSDSPSKILIGKFLLEYVMAQNPEEVAEFSGAVLFEVVLGAILIYLTGGVGLVFRAARAITDNLLALLRKVGEILIKIANLIKSATIKSASLVRGVAGKAAKRVRIPRPQKINPEPMRQPSNTVQPPLRTAYTEEVGQLKNLGEQMRLEGESPENIARKLHQMRRDLGVKYKNLTPPDKLKEIHIRNTEKYGDELGPTVDWLRGRGKTWEQIIESSSRPGGKDLGL